MSYGAARDKQETQREDDSVSYLPCAFCRKRTLISILSQHGARCVECFDAYCAKPQGNVTREGYESEGRRAWAFKLRDRHQAGERLTKAQIDAYRAVCGLSGGIGES
jgi:hypothetical protein